MESTCLLRTRDPVLKLVLAPDKGLWVSMTNSDIELFHVDAVLQVQLRVYRGCGLLTGYGGRGDACMLCSLLSARWVRACGYGRVAMRC